ncbi:MAG: hypothetical protein HYZ37_09555 [Candidatus Solibacter usitatus]|nr:hypothetical protein [Candidatus Solibacter usitatus]
MHISIGYEGRLEDPSRLDELLTFVREFSTKAGWGLREVLTPVSGIAMRRMKKEGMHGSELWLREQPPAPSTPLTIGTPFDDTMRGLFLHTPDTIPVPIIFDNSGAFRLWSKLTTDMLTGPVRRDVQYYLEFAPFAVTTGAVESHVRILQLLLRLKRKFIPELKIDDPTEFFKDCNFDRLAEAHMIIAAVAFSKNPEAEKFLLEITGVSKGEQSKAASTVH